MISRINHLIMNAIKNILMPMYRDYLYYKYKRLYNKNPRLAADALYYKKYGRHMNLDNPVNLIEKITWMSLNTDTSLWTLCADKYRMRSYVESKGLGYFLPKCYGFWENPDDINFDKLPNQFVMKANNGCGTVMIIREKLTLNITDVKIRLKKWIDRPFGYMGAEKHYLSILPGILAEELLTQTEDLDRISPNSIVDFKIWCLNGKPESILVVYDRCGSSIQMALYDTNWNPIHQHLVNTKHCKYNKSTDLARPKFLAEMLDIATKLSCDFKEVRVDFYETNEKPIIGELTFTSGYGYFTDEYYNYLGSKITI